MSAEPARRRRLPSIEYVFMLPIAAAIGYTIWFFFTYDYLPQPFFYEPSGTWMDWYSLTRWAHMEGAYDTEGSIYPPLTFVLMKIFTVPHCYALTISEEARDCDWLGGAALSTMFLANIVLTYFTFRRIDPRTAIPRTFALALGCPMLFAFERGNLLIFTYACMLLGFGPLVKSARLRWLFVGLAVNFKVYLISAVAAPLLKRRWVVFEGMLIATVLVYLATWFIMGEGGPDQIVRNISNYTAGFGAAAALDLWFAATYIPLRTLMTGSFPIYTILGSREADMVVIGVTVFTRAIQGLILLAALAAWLRPEVVSLRRVVLLAVTLALSSSEAGGYTEILMLLFVFMEPRRGGWRTIAIVIAYILCIPADYTFGKLPPLVRYSWLSDVEVIVQYGVGLMSLLRPGLSMIMAALFAGATIQAVWQDIRAQGWRQRWRFRHDLPLFTGSGAAVRPNAGHTAP